MLRNNTNDLAQTIAQLFNTIYIAAKKKDGITLQQLREQYRPIKLKPFSNVAMLTDEKRFYAFPHSIFSQDNYLCVYSHGVTPTQLLASQGEVEAVNFLLSHGASQYEAALGYAMQEIYDEDEFCGATAKRNYLQWVKSQFNKDKDDLPLDEKQFMQISGHIQAGHPVSIYKLVLLARYKPNPFVSAFITHAAMASHDEMVDEITQQIDFFIKDAILGYAFVGNESKVNQFIALPTSNGSLEKESTAAQGYTMGGYLEFAAKIINRHSSFNLLEQSAFTLARLYPSCHPAFGYPIILQQYYVHLADAPITSSVMMKYGFTHEFVKLSSIEKLKHLIGQFHFNYHQAAAWIDPAFFTMAMDGVALVKEAKLPLDVFITILSFVSSNLNFKETLATFDQITLHCHLALLKNAIDLYNKPFYDSNRFHRYRAKSFKQACEEVKSTKELHGLIQNQLCFFNKPIETHVKNQSLKAHELPVKNKVNDKFTEILKKFDQRLEGRYKI